MHVESRPRQRRPGEALGEQLAIAPRSDGVVGEDIHQPGLEIGEPGLGGAELSVGDAGDADLARQVLGDFPVEGDRAVCGEIEQQGADHGLRRLGPADLRAGADPLAVGGDVVSLPGPDSDDGGTRSAVLHGGGHRFVDASREGAVDGVHRGVADDGTRAAARGEAEDCDREQGHCGCASAPTEPSNHKTANPGRDTEQMESIA